ncbi:Pescadillo-like protein [Exophiala dermatitidis]
MAKQKKKGQAGQAKNYITRTQAVRKLQISLPDFRRLCIFKGIYPREPRNIKKANKSATHSTTFYYTKDIQYLLHEPLLQKFREQKALSKKIARSLGRNEVQDAVRLEKQAMPKVKLDHIVRERYPTFVDALRDLDDALSLLFLFANLPSTSAVPAKVIARCQRLTHEFEHYLIATHSLRKSFLSIKGIYYQATIQGQDIMWLVPYKFVQRITQDVDYRIMGTFVEFYCTLLGFVNYKLYTSIGLVYPPKFDVASDERGAELAAFTLQGHQVAGAIAPKEEEQKTLTNGHGLAQNPEEIQAQIAKIAEQDVVEDDTNQDEAPEEPADDGTIDTFKPAAPEGDILPQPDLSGDEAASLFSNFTFFISREAPRHPIEFLLRAFGCKRIGWDTVLGDGAFTHDETDPRITHQIVDRPALAQPLPALQGQTDNKDQTLQAVKPGFIIPGRTYVQPQWIWDCINEGKLLRTDLYAPGATLPPHLSPWVRPTSGQYDPRATLEEQEPEGEADQDVAEEEEEVEEGSDDEEDESDQEEDESEDEDEEVDAGDMDVAGSEEESEEEDQEVDGFAGFGDDDAASDASSELDEEAQHQKELEAEALGKPVPVAKSKEDAQKAKARKARETAQSKKEEEIERQKMMMSNKKRKLFEKMQYSNNKRDVEAEKLRAKRRKLERAKGKA